MTTITYNSSQIRTINERTFWIGNLIPGAGGWIRIVSLVK